MEHHGRSRSFRRITSAIALGGVLLVTLLRPAPAVAATYVREAPSTLGFPIGWYSGLGMASSLPEIAADGMNSVVPYHSAYSHVRPYLDAAKSRGIRVWIEIPRPLVKAVDTTGVASFVRTHAAHPALLGWYLADEPSTNKALGPLSAENATRLYQAIKQIDAVHPVAMAFNPSEPAESYRPAMDVIMAGRYPCVDFSLEFAGLASWTTTMRKLATVAAGEADFFPIVQSYGGAFGRRLPTLAEHRYMVYTSLQLGATGMFFWAHYRADRAWVGKVLAPTVKDLNQMRPALADRQSAGLVASSRSDVTATTFRDAETGTTFVVAVHHGMGTVDSPLTLDETITSTKASRLGPNPTTVSISNHKLPQKLGPYGVQVYRLL